MLTYTVCEKIKNSDIWKTWSADQIVCFQMSNAYMVVPNDVFESAVKICFNMSEFSIENISSIIPLYQAKFNRPLPLKSMLASLPKSFYLFRVK